MDNREKNEAPPTSGNSNEDIEAALILLSMSRQETTPPTSRYSNAEMEAALALLSMSRQEITPHTTKPAKQSLRPRDSINPNEATIEKSKHAIPVFGDVRLLGVVPVLGEKPTRAQRRGEAKLLEMGLELSRIESESKLVAESKPRLFGSGEEFANGPPLKQVTLSRITTTTTTTEATFSELSKKRRSPTTTEAMLPASSQEEQAAHDFRVKEEKYFRAGQVKDHLLKLPPKRQLYITKQGELSLSATDPPYDFHSRPAKRAKPNHPKLTQSIENGTVTPFKQEYYEDMDHDVNIPFAGNPSDLPHRPRQHMIERFGKMVAEKAAAEQEKQQLTAVRLAFEKAAAENASDYSAIDYSSLDKPTALSSDLWRALANTPTLSLGPIATFISRDANLDAVQEDAFQQRPSIKIGIPDVLKGLLVDDWENVTKNNQLVPLPHPKPVDTVLGDYLEYEKPKRAEGSASVDILDETIAGLKEYFDKCLGRILLYRFERAQYAEIRERWADTASELHGKNPCSTYGVEHLMRLMTSLPELIAQTNMDQQSVNRLREELTKFCTWLERHAGDYFLAEYETPNTEYTEKAKH
ncbi:MRG-domain-containing protein [Xylariales sp. AK1849]|nr:MRG-domain-containing protein [Xylariales sp. AK1849]